MISSLWRIRLDPHGWAQGGSAAMPGARLGGISLTCLVILSALALLPGLGSSSRLTYHEAFVAQGAREILDSGNWAYPTIGGLPWLEKPPLPWWLVAALGRCTNGVNETVARFPSALAAIGLVVGIAMLAARHYGSSIGLLAGAVQATTGWTVMRGRLAEADILLACLITWAIVAFDQIFPGTAVQSVESPSDSPGHWRLWRWAFLVLLGGTALVKGIGFGVVLILSVVGGVSLWERNRISLHRLRLPAGWTLTVIIAVAWPLSMVARHGYGALSLWMMHVSDRLVRQQGAGQFAGEPWWEYVLGLLGQALPWTPLAIAGSWRSLGRALVRSKGPKCNVDAAIPAVVVAGDRLLLAWAAVPLGLLALAPVKNAHYAISAQGPWSIWAALALARLGERLRLQGYHRNVLVRMGHLGFVALALSYGLGFWLLGPWFDRRGREWAFYEVAGLQVPASMPLTLLYDDWDRNPYESPFGLIPHDLAVRLFYLGRPACWHLDPSSLLAHDHVKPGVSRITSHSIADESRIKLHNAPFAVIGRDRDLPLLRQFGQVEVVARGPSYRNDRTYTVFRVNGGPVELRSASYVQFTAQNQGGNTVRSPASLR
jgi:4-amino-4-deoxy-L-arabinose transferase-like glycosyltransferase